MNLKMIAEILNDQEENNLDQFANEKQIIEKFIEMKNEIYFKEKVREETVAAMQIRSIILNDLEKEFRHLAMRKIFGDDVCELFDISIHDVDYYIENGYTKHGLLKVHFGQIDFIHRRFAEFYSGIFDIEHSIRDKIYDVCLNMSGLNMVIDRIMESLSGKTLESRRRHLKTLFESDEFTDHFLMVNREVERQTDHIIEKERLLI
jgi:hypothetical protein